jgi:hypothetical protein
LAPNRRFRCRICWSTSLSKFERRDATTKITELTPTKPHVQSRPPTDKQNAHRNQSTTTTSGKNHELGIFQPNPQITIPHDASPIPSTCRSHPPDQATITLCSKRARRFCIGTYYLGTNTVARLRKQTARFATMAAATASVVCEATAQDPRHETKRMEHVSIRRTVV